MKSDVITVTNAGEGMEAAIEQASASAAYRSLSGKDSLRLRLIAEEMLGMFRQITGKAEAVFWVESEGKKYELHMAAHPLVTGEMRKGLLSVSTSGKNAAAVGVMGKLRDIFECAFDAEELGNSLSYSKHYMRGLTMATAVDTADPLAVAVNEGMISWSMQKYKESLEQEQESDAEAREDWDELEKSIIANIADEVSVSIRGTNIEMTVYKNFE